MSSYPTPPGAWLGGSLDSTLTPIGPPGSNTPIGPPGSNTPIGPPGSNTPIGPPGSNTPIGPPRSALQQWQGIDPAWTYADPAALLGQALRKSRSKVMRGSAGGLSAAAIALSASSGRPLRGSNLWRWAPQFRVLALQGELLTRCHIEQGSLSLLNMSAGRSRRLTLQAIFDVQQARKVVGSPTQVDKVLRAAVEREDRLPEILSQANDFWPFFESLTGIALGNAPRLAELLAVAQGVTTQLLMAMKHQVAALRPFQCSSLVLPVIPTPGHGSLPSGHATVAAMQSALLSQLLGTKRADSFHAERSEQLDRLARRIAFNRVVAGVHFPVDSLVGYAFGSQLARLFAALAGESIMPVAVGDAEIAQIDADYELPELSSRRLPSNGPRRRVAPVVAWHELWQATLDELALLRI